MSFTAVIVLHDSEPELRVLLASLDAHLEDRPQLVVVDSGSRDGGAQLARAHGAEVIERADNPGFGAASNAGLAARRGRTSRCCSTPTASCSTARWPHSRRSRGRIPRALHAPRLLNADGSVQRSVHPLPGTAGALLPALVHPPLLPRALRERAEPHRADAARTVGWAIAACLAGATATLRGLGPFDPAVHLFAEDMELGLRARAAGIATVLHPRLRLRHAGGHATLRAGEPFDLLARRRREAIAGTLGARSLALDDLGQALTFATRAAGHAALGGDARRPRAQLAALRRARRPVRAATPPVGGPP